MGIVSPGFSGRRRAVGARAAAGPVPHRGLPGPVGRSDALGWTPDRWDVHGHHRDRREASSGRGRSSARCRPRASPPTCTASRAGPSSARTGTASPSTRCSRTSRRRRTTRWCTRTAATPPTCRWRTCSTDRPGWRSGTTATTSRPSTAARPGCWSRTCTCGRARSGSAASRCRTRTPPASGRACGYHSYGDPWREQRYWGD